MLHLTTYKISGMSEDMTFPLGATLKDLTTQLMQWHGSDAKGMHALVKKVFWKRLQVSTEGGLGSSLST